MKISSSSLLFENSLPAVAQTKTSTMMPAVGFFLAIMATISVALCYIFKNIIIEIFFPSNDGQSAEQESLLNKDGIEMNMTCLSMKDIGWSNILTIFVNGNSIQLTNPDPSELLVTFIRDKVGLKGTKLGCEEGGCGACTVVLTKPEGIVSVNSCLRPLCANDGMAVTTVEGIGSVKDDLSEEQKRLVGNNGTQCGFCTPGWITNMHALNQANEATGNTSTKREIDAYLDGNICRCTGYRPIVQAFQSFADDSSSTTKSGCSGSASASVGCGSGAAGGIKKHPCVEFNCSAERIAKCVSQGHDVDNCCGDLEDNFSSGNNKSHCASSKSVCGPGTLSRPLGKRRAVRDLALVRSYDPQPLLFFNPVSGQRWIRPVSLPQLCAVLRDVAPTPTQAQYVQLVGGNTSIGVTKYLNGSGPYNTADKYSTFIDVNQVQEMVVQSFDPASKQLTVGAATSISTLIALLNQYAPALPTGGGAGVGGSGSDALMASESATGHAVNHHSAFSVTANHLSKIANTQVRNAGSWAGNLMVFLKYPTFPSDAVLALATAGAQLHLCNLYGQSSVIDMQAFMSSYTLVDFQNQGLMITSLTICDTPNLSLGLLSRPSAAFNTTSASVVSSPLYAPQVGQGKTEFVTETFKVANRARNAHAQVNAGFQFEIEAPKHSYFNASTGANASSGPPTCKAARIVYGGVSNKTFIAYRCQSALQNAPITAETLGRALAALQMDLLAVGPSTEALGSQHFRESVMQSCLYRALLRCYPVFALPANLTSAVLPWVMPVCRGVEVFAPPHGSSTTTTVPVGLPVRKLEGKIQATGEAKYPSDEVMPPQGLYGAMIFSTQCAKKLVALDCSAALALPGVVSVLTAADIPGANVGSGSPYLFVPVGELVETVGAQLGVVVATSEAAANQAASMVVASYASDGSTVPITNIEQAVAKKSFFPNGTSNITVGQDIDQALSSSYRRVSGHISAGGQYHFYMEAQTAVACTVDGDNITVTCGSQYPVAYQAQIATVLGVPLNKVVIKCPRTGGAFGGKIFRGIPVSCAAALASSKLGRPVRIFNTRTADMAQQSGREGWIADYEVGFSADGTITALKYNFYLDAGIDSGDTAGSAFMGMYWADNAYFFPNYRADATLCYTNTPARTSMRAPGVVQASFCTEFVVERVAHELGLPVTQVQQKNFIADGELAICGQVIQDCTLPTVWSTLLQRSRYDNRLSLVNQYNARNLWRKRGISICPVKYGMGWAGYNAGVQVGINQADGTVLLSHSGAEIGQGINTKAAQAVASALGIDIKLIRVCSTDTDKVVNGGCTGGSGTSEVIVQAALNACQKINDRLAPYRNNGKFGKTSPQDWVALLKSLPYDVSLNAEGWYSPNENPNGQFFQYFVYAACVTELELDVLTGEVHVLAAELVYDCGQSLNPAVDIGQIEGALVMGLGYFLTERVEYDESNGQLLTNGTWEYKPPLAQDIPGVMNVTLLRNKFNESGILGSKAVGEPPYVVANSVYFALKMAVTSARVDAGAGCGHFDMEVPATVDVRQQACLLNPGRFVMPY